MLYGPNKPHNQYKTSELRPRIRRKNTDVDVTSLQVEKVSSVRSAMKDIKKRMKLLVQDHASNKPHLTIYIRLIRR